MNVQRTVDNLSYKKKTYTRKQTDETTHLSLIRVRSAVGFLYDEYSNGINGRLRVLLGQLVGDDILLALQRLKLEITIKVVRFSKKK